MARDSRRTFFILIVLMVALVLYFNFAPKSTPYETSDYIEVTASEANPQKVLRVALSEQGRTLFTRGLDEVLKRDLGAAIGTFSDLVDLEPNSPGAYEHLGRVLLLANRRDEAREIFTQGFALVEEEPHWSESFVRWIKGTEATDYIPVADLMINRQFPGQLAYLVEHRMRPMQQGFLGASHILLDRTRLSFPTPIRLPFELLTNAAAGTGTLVLGSSRAREAFRPDVFESVAAGSYAPAVNLASSQAAPVFWLGLVQHLKEVALPGNKKIKAAIVMADPESLADMWLRPFVPPKPVNESMIGGPQSGKVRMHEAWPVWTGLSQIGQWQIPENWEALATDPYANGLNHDSQGTAYKFHGLGPKNVAAFKKLLVLLKEIAEVVLVVEAPLSPMQFSLVSQDSSRSELEKLSAEANVPFTVQTPGQWGLTEKHFFGAKAYALDKMDWWHVNYVGADVFTTNLASVVGSQ